MGITERLAKVLNDPKVLEAIKVSLAEVPDDDDGEDTEYESDEPMRLVEVGETLTFTLTIRRSAE